MGLFDFLNSKEFEQLFETALEKEMSKPKNNSEIYNEIASYYWMLLSLLHIDTFDVFQFPDYEDCRKVLVDRNEYDFDNIFCHNDSEATGALCSIDCLMAELEEESLEKILKKTEKIINKRNQKFK